MASPQYKSSFLLGWKQAVRALSFRNYRLYWIGQIVSQTGTWMQIIAQGWLVYRLTNSPLMLGLVNFAPLIPAVPISLLAGAITDQFSRRNLIIFTEIVLSLQALVLSVLVWTDLIQIWHIILLNFIMGIASAIEQPARLALIAETVGKDELPNAVALNSSVYNSAQIVGPAIAGVAVAWIGEAGCFLLNGISFFAVIMALLAMRLPPRSPSSDKLRVTHSIIEGLSYIWSEKIIRGLMIIVALSSFLTLPYLALMPVFAKDVLKAGPEGLGILLTCAGIGSIVGALFAGNVKIGFRGKWLTWGYILGPLFVILFCVSRSYQISLGLITLVGASNAIRQTLSSSLLQIIAPQGYHGRVMSIFSILFGGMSRVGALGVGAMAEVTGAPWAMGVSAGASMMAGLILTIRLPDLYRIS